MPPPSDMHGTLVGLLVMLLSLGSIPGFAVAEAPSSAPTSEPNDEPVACEEFAQRQIKLADQQLQQSNYPQALKVLNSTMENCETADVREKIVEVLGEWYGVLQAQGTEGLQQFLNILSNQPHVSSATKSQFKRRVGAQVRALINEAFDEGNIRATYQRCRTYSTFVSDHFMAEYQCGTAAEEIGAQRAAISSFRWLVQNWRAEQAPVEWKQIASTLEELYFLNGQFRDAHRLARQRAQRDPSPEAVLSSLVSLRGAFLSPILQTGSTFYRNSPSRRALSHIEKEMQRVNFPEYVNSFYLLAPDGTVQRGMYGQEANQPSSALLEKATGPVSLLQSSDNSNRAWLVSSLGEQSLVLEFSIATTPDENARLESVYENVQNDDQWDKLYNLEFEETTPATGSAVGTLLNGASLDDQALGRYREVFDASSLLAYYCVQTGDGGIQESYNFDRTNLAYGDEEWNRTSSTPALYHQQVQYNDQTVREVVWPKFVDDEWTGVIRIGLLLG